MNLIESAMKLAIMSHEGQRDKSGKVYIYHPMTVGLRLEKDGYIDEVVASGLLHDVIEDTETTYQDLYDLEFPLVVIDAVNALSRREFETYKLYVTRCLRNQIAFAVKMYDAMHNLERSENVTDIDFLNFIEKRYGGTIEKMQKLLIQNPDYLDGLKRPKTIEVSL